MEYFGAWSPSCEEPLRPSVYDDGEPVEEEEEEEEEPPPSPSTGDEGNPEPAPKRRRLAADGSSLSFGEDAAGRPELKPLNYFGSQFEEPSVRLGHQLIVSRPPDGSRRDWVKIAKVCSFWCEDRCTNDNACTFAHARDELGKCMIRCVPRSPLPSTRRRRVSE